jgi:hypothetical protein
MSKIIAGLVLGVVGIILMLTPWTFIPGVFELFEPHLSLFLEISALLKDKN